MPPTATQARALPPRGTALLLALVAALLLFRLGGFPLLGPDEPRYARVAVEMGRSGDLVTPTLQGSPWLEKPALYYWLSAAACEALGENETAVRLPSVLAAVIAVGVTALVGARLFGAAAGLHAGFVLGTSPLFFIYARAATMDMLVAAAITAATGLLGLRLLRIAGPTAVPAACVCMGLATLAKGPIGFLLPGLVVAGHVAATREWRWLREVVSPLGVTLFVAVAGPWYVAVWRAQGQAFVDVFLLDHNVQRFTSTVHHHPGPPWYYLPILLLGLFPWSGLLLPAALRAAPRRDRPDLFLLLWLGLPLVFFSLAGSKLPGYILPCLPPLALLAGRSAADVVRGEARGSRGAALLGLSIAAVIATTPALVFFLLADPNWRGTLTLAVWAVLIAFLFSRRVPADAAGALRLLRIGASGFLLLLVTAAAPIAAGRESGRELFRDTNGREVLVLGAWRTAWMSGYFYNDGRVREVADVTAVLAAARRGEALVLCGPAERRELEGLAAARVRVLARGPRQNVLLSVVARPDVEPRE